MATIPAPPGARKKNFLTGCAVLAVVIMAIGVGIIGATGIGWWMYSNSNGESEEVIDDELLTMEDVTAADGLPVEDDAVLDEPTDPETEEVAEVDDPSWWSPDYWTGGTDEPNVVTEDEPMAVVEPSESPTPTPAVPATIGFTADGTSFLAPSETGVDVSTAEVVLGEVADSARSAAGRSEVYWVQGTHQDAFSGAQVDRHGNIVDPDDIRRLVGIRTTWTSVPGTVDVAVKCVRVHGTDDEVPGSCLPAQTASR